MYRITIAHYTYIGHTKSFFKRRSGHKSKCNNVNAIGHNLKVYQMIRDNGGWDQCECVPIEEYECDSKMNACIRENYWMQEYNATMNTVRAYQSEDERKESIRQYQQRDEVKEYHRKYAQSDEAKQNRRIYNQTDAGKEICRIWREQNKDSINERRRLKRAADKEK